MSQMKTASAALFIELIATYFLVDFSNGTAQVVAFLSLHLVASIMLATSAIPALPPHYRKPLPMVLALMFSFAFFIPLLGILGVLTAVFVTTLLPRIQTHEPFSEIHPPEYVLSIRDPEIQLRPAGLRSTLLDPTLPTELRMRSLIALQNMSTRVAAPTLRHLLGDPSDDIRLVAYGILDQKEKVINARILDDLDSLNTLTDRDSRVNALQNLAELHWELVYTGLVQGDVRNHTLRQVLKYSEQALGLVENAPGLWLLKGRALHAMHRHDDAAEAYAAAVTCGLPEARALPYLAEIAFDRHDLNALRRHMAALAVTAQPNAVMDPMIRYWTTGAAIA